MVLRIELGLQLFCSGELLFLNRNNFCYIQAIFYASVKMPRLENLKKNGTKIKVNKILLESTSWPVELLVYY